MKILTFSIILFLTNQALYADDVKNCATEATTKVEMNACAFNSYEAADNELNRVYKEILIAYKDDPTFLKKLKIAQRAWIKLRDLDVDLEFPHSDNPRLHYGDHYSMCVSSSKKIKTIQRTNYLKQWLGKGIEGDVCNGSRFTEYQYESIKNK